MITGSLSGCVGSQVMRAVPGTRGGSSPMPGPFECAVSSSVEVEAEKNPSKAELVADKAPKRMKGKTGSLGSHRLVQIHREVVQLTLALQRGPALCTPR